MSIKIVIEPLNVKHATRLYKLTEQNRDYLKVWLSWLDSVSKVEDTLEFIKSILEQRHLLHYVIIYNGNVCGIAGFYKIEQDPKIGLIGYWLSEEYSGKGIMTLAVKQIVELGFVKLKLNKIEIRCAEENTKSRLIAERLGFTEESTMQDAEWLYSKYVNHVVYSLFSHESNVC